MKYLLGLMITSLLLVTPAKAQENPFNDILKDLEAQGQKLKKLADELEETKEANQQLLKDLNRPNRPYGTPFPVQYIWKCNDRKFLLKEIKNDGFIKIGMGWQDNPKTPTNVDTVFEMYGNPKTKNILNVLHTPNHSCVVSSTSNFDFDSDFLKKLKSHGTSKS